MTAFQALLIVWSVAVAVSLVVVVSVVVLLAGVAAHTVVGANRRARRRAGSLGVLADAFPERDLARLDERLERTAMK